MSVYHQLKSYFSYWLNEENEHSLQSPFVYDLYKKVIKRNQRSKPCYSDIEAVRKQFIESKNEISLNDLGSNSTLKEKNKISTIATQGITKKKHSQFFDRLVDYLEAEYIIELGTSLGINTLYLSCEKARKVTTFEGNQSLSAIAQAVFEGNGRENTEIIEGDIDQTLPEFIQKQLKKIDLVYFDANHTYEATINYFDLLRKKRHDKTCFIFDDIHRSTEMEMAWDEIKDHYEVTLSIDLYQFGLVFFNPEIRKQDYILTF